MALGTVSQVTIFDQTDGFTAGVTVDGTSQTLYNGHALLGFGITIVLGGVTNFQFQLEYDDGGGTFYNPTPTEGSTVQWFDAPEILTADTLQYFNAASTKEPFMVRLPPTWRITVTPTGGTATATTQATVVAFILEEHSAS